MDKNQLLKTMQGIVEGFSKRLTLVEMTIHDFLEMSGQQKEFKEFINKKYGKKPEEAQLEKGQKPTDGKG